MKFIAITQRLIKNESYYEVRDALDTKWGALFSELKYIPIVLPSSYDFEIYFKEMNISGVILSGGNDLFSLSKSNLSKARDDFEIRIISYCVENKIPLLGICRGMQLISEYFGCSLVPVNNHVASKHALNINKDSAYLNLLNGIKDVNSYHNYSLSSCPKEFIISAKSSDDVIEAIEHKQHKILAYMWHPERDEIFEPLQLDLIKGFLGD